ncbi:glycosyltransferase family 61 protein [Caulobacter segnis]
MTAPLTLRPIVEARDLPRMQVPELRERFARGEAGIAWSPEHDASAGAPAGVLGGPEAAAWPHDLAAPPPVDVPATCAIGEAWWFPRFGGLIGTDGALYNATIGEVRHGSQDLSILPGVGENTTRFIPPATAPEIETGAVFLPWGAGFNYGHFVIDALTSLQLLEQTGLLEGVPALAPKLTPWQRDLIALAFPDLVVSEVEAPVVRLKRAVFATSMDHFLHHPNGVLADVAARVLARAPAGKGARRVYLSRRGQSMRVMVGEAAFEKALAARGFTIVRPETLSAGEQVALIRDADVLVGASGAALANAVFLQPGARVVEIQPLNFTSQWVRAACRQVGVDWRGYVCASPCPAREAPLLARFRRGFKFAFRPPLDDLLAFVDQAL